MDKNTGAGIANLRVQAWELHGQFNEPYGSSNVDENGRFILCLDLGKGDRQKPPDLFFKVYRDTQLLTSTEDSVVLKGGEDKEVLIELSIAVAHPEGKDRVNAQQFFTAIDFLTKSDFTGIFSETKSKAGTRVGFVADMVMNTVTKMNVKPIRTANTKEQDVINQPVEGARQKLESEKIVVNEVLPYDPKLNKASLVNLGAAPPRLKEGQKINLYEENGKVRYYSVVQETTANSDFADIAKQHQAQLTKMQEELKFTKETAAKKDEEKTALAKVHKEQLDGIRQELNITKENASKKDAEISQITREHKDQLTKMQEELKATKENTTRKEAEISQITAEHKNQLTKVQEELKATKETTEKKEAEFNALQQDLKTLRQEQAGMMNLLKPENLTKLIKDIQRTDPPDKNIKRNIPPIK